MAEMDDQDEPHIPTALIRRMTARLWRERASMQGAGCGTTTRCCGQST